jgi:hypothetical protein
MGGGGYDGVGMASKGRLTHFLIGETESFIPAAQQVQPRRDLPYASANVNQLQFFASGCQESKEEGSWNSETRERKGAGSVDESI